ncbi:MAG: acyltransferase, partial [Mailhella sp.]|nr:acyltransferase [Mailhella sp.]
MQYRAEIDGLRTLAVMSVTLFHFEMFHIKGGFLGVDIFFVISGFLMTYLITEELREGRFSFSEFYLRRARRILPALFTVLAATLFVICILGFAPKLMEQFFSSLQAAVFSVSNIFFYLTSGYWDSSSVTKPLLHTWSLGVEEQFYFFLPLLLWGLFALFKNNTARYIAVVLALVMAASYAAYLHYGLGSDLDFAFYMLPMRAWELLAGSSAALFVIYRGRLNIFKTWRIHLFEVLCLGAMLGGILAARGGGSMFRHNELVVMTVLGAAFFLAGPGTGAVSRLFSFRPVVWLGKISYSIYLWHWPIWVLFTYYVGSNRDDMPMPLWMRCLLLILIIGMAALSWRFVEQPFRRKSVQWKHIGTVFVPAASLMLAVTMLFPAGAVQGLEAVKYQAAYRVQGSISAEQAEKGLFSTFGKGSGNDFIIIGDSHAGCLFPAFDSSVDSMGLSGTFAGNPSMWLAPDYQGMHPEENRRIVSAAYRHIEKHDIRNVIFIFRMNGKKRGDISEGKTFTYFDAQGRPHKGGDREFYATLEKTIRGLMEQGRHVYLVEQVPH